MTSPLYCLFSVVVFLVEPVGLLLSDGNCNENTNVIHLYIKCGFDTISNSLRRKLVEMTSLRTERNMNESLRLDGRYEACSSRSNMCSAYLQIG